MVLVRFVPVHEQPRLRSPIRQGLPRYRRSGPIAGAVRDLERTCWTDPRRNCVQPAIAHDIGSEIAEGNEHERSLPHPRMRNDQIAIVDDRVADEKDVDIERSRPPAFAPDPIRPFLRGLGGGEKLAGGPIRRQLDDDVEERLLARGAADRVGLIDR